jgi:hypothetical protein
LRADKASSSLSRRVREIVILVVGAAWGLEYELYAHGILGRLAGLRADIVLLVGLYLTTCAIINAFEIPAPQAEVSGSDAAVHAQ